MKVVSRKVIALAALAALGSSAYAQDPSYEELKQQVQALTARLDQVESKTTTLSAQQVDATVERVLQDAQKRSQLLQINGGLTAGYDKGFFIKSDDDNYSFRPGVLFQFRGVTNHRADGDDDTQAGFEVRRIRPRFDGNFITPNLTYSFVLDAARSGGSVTILDAWAQYRFATEWAVKAGQFRESWYHEGDVPDSNQLTVERSLVDSILGGSQVDRVQGVSLIYGGTKTNSVRVEVTGHDGANSKNTDFQDTDSGNFGAGVRVEYKFFGDWANYRDFSAKGNKEDLLIAGAGADWTQAGDQDIYRTTADVQWENISGLGVYGAINGVCTNVPSGDGEHRFDWGALVQAGYLLNPSWEVFGRYDVVSLDDDYVTGEDLFNEFTVGVNWFLGKDGAAGHRAKITVDVLYLPDGAPSNQTGVGVLSNDGNEVVLRGQFQLVI